MTIEIQEARVLLEQNGQAQVLTHWDRLNDSGKKTLLEQIADLDFKAIGRMKESLKHAAGGALHTDIEPAEVIAATEAKTPAIRKRGEDAIRAGSVAVVLVAGGQGSRLGFEGPKGAYLIGPVSRAPLFAFHARKILALEQKYNAKVPFYIMTSETNDAETRAFFKEHRWFGLAEDRVCFFKQGMWPALWPDGKLVMDRPDHLFMSPDGHGGILRALEQSGSMADMDRRGIRTVFYFQVDNPLVEIAEPGFIGMHLERRADVSVKVCAKRNAQEGLGVVVRRGTRCAVVEYTELTDAQKRETLPDGRLRLLYGSVAIHVFDVGFLKREIQRDMPLHTAHKKVPFCGDDGRTVQPDKPNAFKFEKFIFDVIPDADRAINVEFAREDEFAPVKNASGDDSPATCEAALSAKFARWLEACGVKVPRRADGAPTVKIEIDPVYALGPDDLRQRLPKGFGVTGDVLLK